MCYRFFENVKKNFFFRLNEGVNGCVNEWDLHPFANYDSPSSCMAVKSFFHIRFNDYGNPYHFVKTLTDS